MTPETELLSLQLADCVDFRIRGPLRHLPQGHSPALSQTSLLHVLKSNQKTFEVLGESTADEQSANTVPFLFEQTPYHFDVCLHLESPHKLRLLLRGNDLLAGRKQIGSSKVYSVLVNFGSEVGYTDIELWLGTQRLFNLRLEVFPTKLDYRTDLVELRADLQMEVRALVFELYGRTFQKQHRKSSQRPHDIEWLTVLRQEFDNLTRALEIICRAPLERLKVTHLVDRSFRPTRPSSEIRHYLRRNGSRCTAAPNGHFHALGQSWIAPEIPRVVKSLTPDTAENRFVAAAIGRIRLRLRRLQSQLIGVPKRERFAEWANFLAIAERRIMHFQTQTFLSSISSQQIHVKPTLALHLTIGYREFFSSFLALESVLEVGGGPFELPEKDLATLYELWCFVALASLFRKELGLLPRHPTWLRVTQRRVALELVKGKTSVLSMEKNGEEYLRVIYNREDGTPTGSCYPDNTVEIFKKTGGRPFRYIFDAKYRLKDDDDYINTYKAPGPPPDAIHRMHAYRDQIVAQEATNAGSYPIEGTVWDWGYRQWVQQTVGAFVLYPYAGSDANRNKFVEAIGQVGIGGVPFLPSRRTEVLELLKRIIAVSAESIEDTAVELSTIDERQRIELAHEYGLIAIVPTQQQLDYILKEAVYHTPYDQHRRWGLRLRADFILFLLSASKFPGQAGIAYQAEIKSLHFGERKQIEPSPPPFHRGVAENDHYVWFKLGSPRSVSPTLPYTGTPPRFAFTTRLAFREASDLAELLLIREPERRFYRECRLAGFDVAVHDESVGTGQVFDIGQLRLRFSVLRADGTTVSVRFEPNTATFKSSEFSFTWSELMFSPGDYLKLINDPIYRHKGAVTRSESTKTHA